jgi:IclR family acetate operon transcriptional repressor
MTAQDPAQESNLSQTLLKALDVLECLAAAGRPLTAPEVAKQCGMSRPTVYRLLTTLQTRGYVASHEHEYQPGTKILSLSRVVLESIDVSALAGPFLRELSAASGETTYVSVLDGTTILYINKVESTQSVRSNCTIGTHNPLHSTSMGKAILAYLPAIERARLLDQMTFTYFTPNTITDREALLEELARVRQRGYALDDIEMEDNVRCIGAPIFNHMGQPFAAMSLSGPAFRLPVERLETLSELLIDITQTISRQLGYQPNNIPDA